MSLLAKLAALDPSRLAALRREAERVACGRRALLVAPALLAVAAAGPAAAERVSPLPLEARASLEGRSPREIAYSVDRERSPDGAEWLAMRADFETAYPYAIGDVAALLADYEAASKVFSRVERVRLRSQGEEGAVTEQRSVVRVLGLSFVSELTFRNTVEAPGPGRVTQRFRSIETDGSAYQSFGSWELESIGPEGKGGTYLRYRAETWVAPRFPGQEGIMRSFGAADFSKVLKELGKALEGRAEQGSGRLHSRARPRMAAAAA